MCLAVREDWIRAHFDRETTGVRVMTIEAVRRQAPAGTMNGQSKVKTLPSLLLLLLMSASLAWPSASMSQRANAQPISLSQLERSLLRVPAHISEFSPVSEPLALPKCGLVRPPEALLTPDPLLHSAFVLTGARSDEDEAVLRAVRQWRYRPALCNGVPTDSEARVRFSIR